MKFWVKITGKNIAFPDLPKSFREIMINGAVF